MLFAISVLLLYMFLLLYLFCYNIGMLVKQLQLHFYIKTNKIIIISNVNVKAVLYQT